MFRTPDENRTDGKREPGSGNRETGAIPGTRYPKPGARTPRPEPRAFTLIEMVVVVAIIGLLLAIAVPTSVGLVNSQKVKSTKMTMQTLDAAISAFASEASNPANSPNGAWYKSRFGKFPPSPVSAVFLENGKPEFTVEGPSQFDKDDRSPTVRGFTENPGTKQKFEYLTREYIVNLPSWYYNDDSNWHLRDYPDTDKYLSIETLVLFLQQFSPQARASLSRMQKALTNKDADRISWDKDGLTSTTYDIVKTDLSEITDAWGNPLRYAVQTPVVNTVNGIAMKIRWELRSAGPDGLFNPTFTTSPVVDGTFASEDQAGDDVILRGP